MVQRGCFFSDSEVEYLLDLCQAYEHSKKEDYSDTLEKYVALKIIAEAVVTSLVSILDKVY